MAKIGIDASLSCIAGLRSLALDAVELTKKGSFFTRIPKTLAVLAALYSLAKEASNVLPELNDLDAEESASLATRVYEAAKEIISAAGNR